MRVLRFLQCGRDWLLSIAGPFHPEVTLQEKQNSAAIAALLGILSLQLLLASHQRLRLKMQKPRKTVAFLFFLRCGRDSNPRPSA
jgi:hypothetical protein